ncbi:MAG: thermosome subunit [Methanobacteriota archaeon]|nr:MAG: thermosome subunit [Euryarchaeota archaeon]
MATPQPSQPILILKEGTQRQTGRDVRNTNIQVARIMGEAVKSTLGPKGMDKMLIDTFGDVVLTNDGATILKKMDVQHPAAKTIAEVAKTLDDEVGDGTTTAVMLTGELLREASELMAARIHPASILSGYGIAAKEAVGYLEKISVDIGEDEEKIYRNLVKTAIAGKVSETSPDKIVDLVVKAVHYATTEENGKRVFDKDQVKIVKQETGSVLDSELVEGLVLLKERAHPGMPERVEDAKVALVTESIKIEETEVDAEIAITTPGELKKFKDQETENLKKMVEKIKNVGANVVIVQKGIDDKVQDMLAKNGIFAVKRVRKSEMEQLARATGAKIVSRVKDITPDKLGYAGVVEEKKLGDENRVFVEKCKNPRSVTIVIRGGTKHVTEEVERGVEDGLKTLSTVVEDRRILAGGGAPEINVSRHLRKVAEKVTGKEQLAVIAFAKALESIPQTLARNAGFNPMDTLADLKAAHEKSGTPWIGIDLENGKPVDMMEKGVLEPLRVKTQAIESAHETAALLLRVDDMIVAKKEDLSKDLEKKPKKFGTTGKKW